MPRFYNPHPQRNQPTESDHTYDPELHMCLVYYDEMNDYFICGFCVEDFSVSQLDYYEGGALSPMHSLRESRKTFKTLREVTCGLCGLSATRAFDE